MNGPAIGGYPRRVVCLTEETTETLYVLGEGDRVVGVSAYTVRPPEARQKPAVSAFVSARYDKILELRPDIVFTFSDLQADLSAELIRRGVAVFAFNQRTVREILEMVLTISRIMGVPQKGEELVQNLQSHLKEIEAKAARLASRPKVFFEEWNDPLISGIGWVEELIELAGGDPIFPELREGKSAKERTVSSQDVVERRPDVIIASWCGRRVDTDSIRQRPGWAEIPAVRDRHVYDVGSEMILQPGPAALTDGVRRIHEILARVVESRPPRGPAKVQIRPR